MIRFVSSGIVKWLLDSEAISQQDKELYEYAAYSLLFSVVPLILVLLAGALMGMLSEGIAFILPFLLLRKFSGGYHIKSSKVCFVVSILVILLSLLVIKFLIRAEANLYCIPAVILSTIQLIIFSPIDSEARRLSKKQRKIFRQIIWIICIITVCVYAATIYFQLQMLSICIASGLVLTACLQWPCIIMMLRAKIK